VEFLSFLKEHFKSLFACVLLLGISLNAMSSKEQEACKALQVIAREATSEFDSKQSPKKQWEHLKHIIDQMNACMKSLEIDTDALSIPFHEAYFATVLPQFGKKIIDQIICLHQALGRNFFKDPGQVEFSYNFVPVLICGEYVSELEAAKKANNGEAQAIAAMGKAVQRFVDYAVMCRALGIKVRELVAVGDAFRSIFGGGQDFCIGTANFIALAFAPLEQNGLIGNEERDDILYTYAEIDEMIAFANDPRLRPYVDSLTVSGAR
jgi:uncharacterized FlaG/YvyC family protein